MIKEFARPALNGSQSIGTSNRHSQWNDIAASYL